MKPEYQFTEDELDILFELARENERYELDVDGETRRKIGELETVSKRNKRAAPLLERITGIVGDLGEVEQRDHLTIEIKPRACDRYIWSVNHVTINIDRAIEILDNAGDELDFTPEGRIERLCRHDDDGAARLCSRIEKQFGRVGMEGELLTMELEDFDARLESIAKEYGIEWECEENQKHHGGSKGYVSIVSATGTVRLVIYGRGSYAVRYTYFRGISEPASKSFMYIAEALDCFVETMDIVRKAQ